MVRHVLWEDDEEGSIPFYSTMIKWEYLLENTTLWRSEFESRLNNLGRQGWELVAVDQNILYLKRPKNV